MGFVEEITEVDIETTVGIEYDDRPDADQSTSSAADESAHDDLATVQPRVTAGAETDSTAAATATAGVAPRAATSSTSQGTSTSARTATASTNTASFASTATQADDSTAPQNPPQQSQGVT